MPQATGWLEPFDPGVRAALERVAGATGRRIACFDADGTLWAEDIGEAFFRWLIAGHLLPRIDCTKDVYAEYEERVRADRAAGYAWAVQCMAGIPEPDLVRWCTQMAAAWPNYRPEMAGMLRGLSDAGIEVWLVSASSAWIVRAAAPRVGADPGRVIAMSVAVRNGALTDEMVRPLICNAGKVEAIHAAFGRGPDLAVGDSLGDLEMLQDASQALVVGRHDRPGAALVRLASERAWPVHLF
jgi:HAD superfamily phosphoserine phosphatase-like hydrolase